MLYYDAREDEQRAGETLEQFEQCVDAVVGEQVVAQPHIHY